MFETCMSLKYPSCVDTCMSRMYYGCIRLQLLRHVIFIIVSL